MPITMRNLRVAIVLATAMLLLGCETTPEPIPVAEPPEVAPPMPPPEPEPPDDLSASERALRAVDLLQHGRVDEAEQQLKWALADQADQPLATKLMAQIKSDPTDYLGKRYYSYKVKRGESLSRIANRLLGDWQKFYSLAKYNGIDDPSKLATGQTIRIPGKRLVYPKSPPVQEPSESEPIISPIPEPDPDSLTEREPLEEPALLPEREVIIESQPDPGTLESSTVADTGPSDLEVEALYNRGLEEAQAGALEKAYETFVEVLAHRPGHSEAPTQRQQVKTQLVDRDLKKAMSFYRQQQLEEAIGAWDRVLARDPNNEIATHWRIKARDLKQRLENID